jgi:hypothetical protein
MKDIQDDPMKFSGNGGIDDLIADMANDAAQPPAPEAMGDRLQRLAALAEQLRLTQIELYETDTSLAEVEARERRLREIDIPELMKECNMQTFTLKDGTKINVQPALKCNIAEERKAAAFAWLRAKGLGGIIKTAVEVEFGKGAEEQARMAKAAQLLREAKYEPYISESVHWQTLAATIREERSKGHDVPADLFGLYEYETTKLEFPKGIQAPKKPRPKK